MSVKMSFKKTDVKIVRPLSSELTNSTSLFINFSLKAFSIIFPVSILDGWINRWIGLDLISKDLGLRSSSVCHSL